MPRAWAREATAAAAAPAVQEGPAGAASSREMRPKGPPSCPGLRGQSGATGSGGGPGWGRALPEGRCPVGHLQGAQGDAGREGTPPRHSPDSGCGWLGWALVHLSPKQIGVPTVTGQSGPAGTGKNTTRLEALTVTRRPAHWLLDTQDIWLWLTLSQELSQVPSPGTCPAHTLTESGSLEGAEALTLSAPTPVNTPPPWSPPWTLWAPPRAPEAGGSVWGNAPSPAHQGSGVDWGLWQLRPGS